MAQMTREHNSFGTKKQSIFEMDFIGHKHFFVTETLDLVLLQCQTNSTTRCDSKLSLFKEKLHSEIYCTYKVIE